MTKRTTTPDLSAPASVRRRERPRPTSAPIEHPSEATSPRAVANPSTAQSDYEVGYGKPPTHSQFKPGQSGNPKGRPRGSKSPFTLLREELQQKVTLREGDRVTTVTKLEAVLKRVVNDTLGGKVSSTKLLFPLLHVFEAQFATESEPHELSAKDQEIVLAMLQGIGNE